MWANRATLLEALGGEAGCKRLSREFYALVGRDLPAQSMTNWRRAGANNVFWTTPIAAIAAGRDREATVFAPRFLSRPAVFVGLLARMIQFHRADLIGFVIDAVEHDPSLAPRRFGGRTLLHYASGAGRLDVVASLVQLGTDPYIQDGGGHTPLYSVANECASETGPDADVNACGGVTRATALHMAARRGYMEIARTLLDCGASIGARDHKGDTPLQRAANCRRDTVVQLLVERGAV